MNRRQFLKGVFATSATLVAVCPTLLNPVRNRNIYVNPNGLDWNDGLTYKTALKTLSEALRRVESGDTVLIGSGVYREAISTHAVPGKHYSEITFRD